MPWRAEGSPAACDPAVPWGCRNAGPQHSTVVPAYSADVVAVCGSSEDARFLDGLARAPSQALGEASGCPGSPWPGVHGAGASGHTDELGRASHVFMQLGGRRRVQERFTWYTAPRVYTAAGKKITRASKSPPLSICPLILH